MLLNIFISFKKKSSNDFSQSPIFTNPRNSPNILLFIICIDTFGPNRLEINQIHIKSNDMFALLTHQE